jgi:hypothetical protein
MGTDVQGSRRERKKEKGREQAELSLWISN